MSYRAVPSSIVPSRTDRLDVLARTDEVLASITDVLIPAESETRRAAPRFRGCESVGLRTNGVRRG